MYQQHNGPFRDNGSSSLGTGSSTNDGMMQAGDIQLIHIVKEISDLKESASNLFAVPNALENLQETVCIMQDNVEALRKDVKKILGILSTKGPLDKSLSMSKNSSTVNPIMEVLYSRQTEGQGPSITAVPLNRQTQPPSISDMPFNGQTRTPGTSEAASNRIPATVPKSIKRGIDVPDMVENTSQPVKQNAYDNTFNGSKHFQAESRKYEEVPHPKAEVTMIETEGLEDTTFSTNDESLDSTLSDNENENLVHVEELSLFRYKRKKTDLKNDNRVAFFHEGAEIEVPNPDEPSSMASVQPTRVQEERQPVSDEEFPRQFAMSSEHQRQPASVLRHPRQPVKTQEKIQPMRSQEQPVMSKGYPVRLLEQPVRSQGYPVRPQEQSYPTENQIEMEPHQPPSMESGFTQVAQVKPVVKSETLDSEETELKSAVLPTKSGARQIEEQTKEQSLTTEPALHSDTELTKDRTTSLSKSSDAGVASPLSSINTEKESGAPNSAALDDAIPLLEEMTLKEASKAADCQDPKSQGADTIICVDTSDSMAGEPIQQAKDFISEFLDGIEEAAVEYGLEENIAIVTFGHENTIVQNLTNDYGKIRDAVDSLETGGPSPMMTGLVLCLSAIFNRGGVVTYRERRIQPRILLLSDGKATDERVLKGPDVISPPSSKARVHGKLTEFAERIKSEPRIVYCIPVGEAPDQSTGIMKMVSETTGGSIISPDKATYTSRHFLLNTITAKIKTSGIFDDPDSNPERSVLEGMVKEQLKDIADQYLINEVLTMVNEDVARSRTEAALTATKNQKEAELLKNIPPVGTRVRRGKDWKYDPIDDNGPGTVTGHKGKGWVTVEWDSHNKGKYRFGAEAAMDVKPVDEPRYLSDGEMTAVGVRVRRGPDWEWGSQDGGERATGVIFKIEDSGIVHVRWDNGKRGNYRFGLFGKFDVEIYNPGLNSQTASQNEELLGATASPPVHPTRPQWQWKDDNTNQWHDHKQSDSDRIETLHKKGKGTILVTCNGETFRVVPQSLHQRNVSKGITNEIRRKEIPIG